MLLATSSEQRVAKLAQGLASPAMPLAACVQQINCSFYCTLTPFTECQKTKLTSADNANKKLVATAVNVFAGWND